MAQLCAQSADASTVRSFLRPQPIRRAALGVLAGAVVLSPMAGQALANRSSVPASSVTLPTELDWQAEYQGQYLCSPEAKPGALKLSELLDRTYGRYTTYISRSCATPGISEHEEGRAIDWMVDSEVSAQRSKAWQFLNWVTAPGPDGEPAVMARRLGIMYMIYEDKMWRVYRPEDGWTEYSACSGKQDEGYDTSCHRDHIHISLTWDGAYAKTSFWTGRAETRGPCESAATSRRNGTPDDPVTLIDGNKGVGVDGDNCRLAANAYSDRSYKVTVPVPQADGQTPVQRIRLSSLDVNAPVGMTIRSASTVTIPPGTASGGTVDVPLSASGTITVTLGAGYGDVVLQGVGTGDGTSPAPAVTKPPKVRLPAFTDPIRVNTPLAVAGRVKRVPADATVSLQQRVPGSAWTTIATAQAARQYTIDAPAVTTNGAYEYQVVLDQSGARLAQSKVRALTVLPAEVTLQAATAEVRVGRSVRLGGTVFGLPDDAHLRIMLKRARVGQWRVIEDRPRTRDGSFQGAKRMGKVGRFVLRASITTRRTDLTSSAKVRVTVKNPRNPDVDSRGDKPGR